MLNLKEAILKLEDKQIEWTRDEDQPCISSIFEESCFTICYYDKGDEDDSKEHVTFSIEDLTSFEDEFEPFIIYSKTEYFDRLKAFYFQLKEKATVTT